MNNAIMHLEFLKPSTGRMVSFAVLMGALNFLLIAASGGGTGQSLIGVPLGFFPRGYPELGVMPLSFSASRFLFDGVFWYIVSSAVMATREDKDRAAFAKMALILGGAALLLVISFGGYRHGDLKISLVVLSTAIYIGVQQKGRRSAV